MPVDAASRQVNKLQRLFEECRSQAEMPWDATDVTQLRTEVLDLLANIGPRVSHLRDEIRKLTFVEKVQSFRWNERTQDVQPAIVDRVNAGSLRRTAKLLIRALRLLKPLAKSDGGKEEFVARSTPKRRRGPPGDNNCHVAKIAQDLENWRQRLAELCGALDEAKIPISKQWERQLKDKFKVKKPTWTDALEYKGDVAVIQRI